ncbi:MAG: putative ribonuclease H [Prokaryotic dsDNA virus sp.]|nr:MAG: putative ribonuclease H [Prokaryotic dsDNA virus sp.]|tara:strand:+ start:28029 stop:28712 length:684 start_codon:yes stop_codon:yes gene_type:complete
MVILFDADSLIYSSCINVDDNVELGIAKFDEVLMSIVNHLEEYWEIQELILFNSARGNYRKILDKEYKAPRGKYELPKILGDIQQYVIKTYESKRAYGMETDDLVAIYWNRLQQEHGRNNVIIVSIDKDYKQLPALIYNYHYKHKEIYDVSPHDALYNFYTQMIVGDSADNVNYCKGYGKKYTEKLFKDCTSHYQFTKRTYDLFKKIYKGKGRMKYIQCYHLLRLRT